jgi:hypothetical protein
MHSPHEFLTSESGAVTVDWVVLTAAIVGLGLATMAVVSGGVEDLSRDIDSELVATDPTESPFAGLRAFDISGYIPLTGDENFGVITAATAGQTDEQLRNWGNLAMQIAMDPNQTPETRRQEADTYAARYALLQERGADVSGMTDPREVAAAVEADLG